MKTLLNLLLLVLILNSCESKKEDLALTNVCSFDFEKYSNEGRLKLIDLDSIENYAELILEMEKITCDDKIPGLKINLKPNVYFMAGFASCPTSGMVNCYFRRNHIDIINDSIFHSSSKMDGIIPIENLKIELDTLMSKSYNFQYDNKNLKPALINLHMDDTCSISMTKRVLGEIAEQFEGIRYDKGPEYFQYQILFDDTHYFGMKPPPPPPPPKPKSSQDEE